MDDTLIIQKAYYKSTGHYSFRPEELAEIISIDTVTPKGQTPRVCFQVKYADGMIDWIPLSDYPAQYEIVCQGTERLAFVEKA